jgi:hypothetical protein
LRVPNKFHIFDKKNMVTQIFESYLHFICREDKTLNGVSQVFADNNPGWQKDNETNKGCWNCSDCSR